MSIRGSFKTTSVEHFRWECLIANKPYTVGKMADGRGLRMSAKKTPPTYLGTERSIETNNEINHIIASYCVRFLRKNICQKLNPPKKQVILAAFYVELSCTGDCIDLPSCWIWLKTDQLPSSAMSLTSVPKHKAFLFKHITFLHCVGCFRL